MSKGDLLTQGQKGYNAPWQKAMLGFLKKISEGSSGPSTQKTPDLFRTSAAGIITAGTFSVSFYNAGATNATVLSGLLKPGEQVTFGDPNGLTPLSYDGTGTDLLITTLS